MPATKACTDPLPYEAIVSLALEQTGEEQQARWRQAELALLAVGGRGITERAWAAEIGCSAARVRQMCRVVTAFPTEESRYPMLSFEHHVVASGTPAPTEWMASAHAHDWSLKDLRRAIRDEKAPTPDEGAILAEGEHLLHRLRQWAAAAPPPLRAQVLGRVRAWISNFR